MARNLKPQLRYTEKRTKCRIIYSWSSRAIKWVRASVIFTAIGLSLDIFSRFCSICCKVGCCCFSLKQLLLTSHLDNLAECNLQSAQPLSSLLILKYFQTAYIAPLLPACSADQRIKIVLQQHEQSVLANTQYWYQ